MGVMKSFIISPTFRKASNRSLVKHLPSNLLYSFGAALYDKANKQTSKVKQAFYRKAVDRVIATVRNLKTLEEQYYDATK